MPHVEVREHFSGLGFLLELWNLKDQAWQSTLPAQIQIWKGPYLQPKHDYSLFIRDLCVSGTEAFCTFICWSLGPAVPGQDILASIAAQQLHARNGNGPGHRDSAL